MLANSSIECFIAQNGANAKAAPKHEQQGFAEHDGNAIEQQTPARESALRFRDALIKRVAQAARRLVW